jgi:hypothetical protein
MGHSRLGEMPKTGYWKDVIDKLDILDDPKQIACITARAAHKGLDLAKKDIGLANVVFLFMKSVIASRSKDFSDSLAEHNINLSPSAGLADFVGELDEAIDKCLRRSNHRSHLAEMARFSAIDSLQEAFSVKTKSLFQDDIESTRQSIKEHATKKGFSAIGQKFWGCFLSRFLDYHLSREIANHIGPEKPFKTINQCNSFRIAFDRHCKETVEIVKDFTGCWPSVTEFRGGMTAENVGTKFVPVALDKIKKELSLR